jgi:hypothetical protein
MSEATEWIGVLAIGFALGFGTTFSSGCGIICLASHQFRLIGAIFANLLLYLSALAVDSRRTNPRRTNPKSNPSTE